MMGEKDLQPEGYKKDACGKRVLSMMSPTLIKKDKEIFAVLGSGGSNRIPSAIFQVALNLMDEKMSVQKAVEYPRLHFDEKKTLQIEAGFSKKRQEKLRELYPLCNQFSKKEMYFGGVQVVINSFEGWGDSRRDGVSLSI